MVNNLPILPGSIPETAVTNVLNGSGMCGCPFIGAEPDD
jgi:hypothetical protein